MKRIIYFTIFMLIFCIFNSLLAQIDIEKIIPANWEVQKILQVPARQLPSFSAKLNGEILQIKNYFIKTEQGEIQVNKIVCRTVIESKKVYESLRNLHQNENACYRKNEEVFEFISQNNELVNKLNEIISATKEQNHLKIKLTSVFVDDQEKALKFYTEVLGFVKKEDIPLGQFRWLTVVSAGGPHYVEFVLEPNSYEAVKEFQQKLFSMGIPIAAFEVKDVREKYEELKKSGVQFTVEPTEAPGSIIAVFNDTCGNLIQIYQVL